MAAKSVIHREQREFQAKTSEILDALKTDMVALNKKVDRLADRLETLVGKLILARDLLKEFGPRRESEAAEPDPPAKKATKAR